MCGIPYVRSHDSLFYFHDFRFFDDSFIFTMADWSSFHSENKKKTVSFVHTVLSILANQFIRKRSIDLLKIIV